LKAAACAHAKVLQAQARLESAKVELSACGKPQRFQCASNWSNFIQGADTTVVPEPYAFHADNSDLCPSNDFL